MESIFWVYQLADLSRSIFGGSHQVVRNLLTEVWECWKKANEERVSVYASDAKNDWRLIASHPKRSPESIILDRGVKEDLIDDAREFLSSKKWYSERGIPFRRGYLLVSYIHVCAHTSVDITP